VNWLRRNTKSIIIFTVLAFVGTIFFQWGMNYMGRGGSQRRSLANVNGDEIQFNEFQNRLNEQRERYRNRNPGPMNSEEIKQIRRRTFRQIVNEMILQNHLKKVGIPASDAQVRAYIRQRHFTTPDGQFLRRQWQQFLQQSSSQRKTRLEEAQRRQIETTRMQTWLASHVTLSEVELQQMLRAGLREAHLFGILLDPTSYISEEKITTYYDANADQYQASPRARVRKIYFPSSDTSTGNQQKQLKEMKRQLEIIRRRFQSGDSFPILAKEFSQDTATRESGGDMGWVTSRKLTEKKSRTIFQLEEGEISNLVKTRDGYHLYYMQEGPVRNRKPLSEVRPRIEQKLLSDSHWEAARDEAERLHREITGSGDTIAQFRDSAVIYSDGKTSDREGAYGWVPARFIVPSIHDSADTRTWVGELGNQFIINEKISRTVFSGPAGDVREPVRSPHGVHLFYVEDFREPRLNQLSDSDRNRIRSILRREKRSQYLREWLKMMRERAKIELNVPESQVGGGLQA